MRCDLLKAQFLLFHLVYIVCKTGLMGICRKEKKQLYLCQNQVAFIVKD